MRPGADLSMGGQAELLGELIERLDLDDVTLVVNDWGGPLVTAVRHPDLVARLVVTPCEAFDNMPPGLPGRFAELAGRHARWHLHGRPGAADSGAVAACRSRSGRWSSAPFPGDLVAGWIEAARHQRAVRRDLETYIRTTDHDVLEVIVDDLAALDIPALVAWTTDGRVMPAEHGPRLAELLPHGHYAEIPDARVLVQLDQPGTVAAMIRQFIRRPPARPAAAGSTPRRRRRSCHRP